MSNQSRLRLLMAAIAILAYAPARADIVMRVGDSVYVNGHRYSREEWEKINSGAAPTSAEKAPPSAEKDANAAPVAPPASKAPAAASEIQGPRAAACRTTRRYDEFPDPGEKFACDASLGSLTREEILRLGWKIDLIEKLPAPAGEPATSARGLPLSSYKLILSR